MSEKKLSAEKLYGSLEEIKGKLNNAFRLTGLPSSRSLCHYINYAIALKLNQDLNLPIMEYGLGVGNNFSKETPSIGYVANAWLDNGHSKVKHSYLLIFGVEESPILVDGANDQADPSTPFLVARLAKNDYSSINYSLKKLDHPIKELGFKERRDQSQIRNMLLRILPEMIQKHYITNNDVNKLMYQFDLEDKIGLNYLFFGMSRDWLTYFTKSLGIEYPSLQYIQEAIFSFAKMKGIPIPQNFEDTELETLTRQSLLRLKEEGVV